MAYGEMKRRTEKVASEYAVFISHSRDRSHREALSIAAQLSKLSIDALIDTESIAPAQQWEQEIVNLIAESDALVFLLTNEALNSEPCQDELHHAKELGKLIIPIVYEARIRNGEDLPSELRWIATYNWIRPELVKPTTSLAGLIEQALTADPAWARLHRQVTIRARDWRTNGERRSDLATGRLLETLELEAKHSRPRSQSQLEALHEEYIAKSVTRRTVDRSISVAGTLLAVALLAVGLFYWQGSRTSRAENKYVEVSTSIDDSDTILGALNLVEDLAKIRGVSSEAKASILLRTIARKEAPLTSFPLIDSASSSSWALSSDGTTLALVDDASRLLVVDLWTLTTADLGPESPPVTSLSSLALSSDGNSLAVLTGSDFQMWSRSSDRWTQALSTAAPGDGVGGITFGSDEKSIVAIRLDGTLAVWAIDGGSLTDRGSLGEPLTRPSIASEDTSLRYVISEDRRRVCTSVGRLSQLIQVEPGTNLTRPLEATGCIPEGCDADLTNFAREAEGLHCYDSNGADLGVNYPATALAIDRTLLDHDWQRELAGQWSAEPIEDYFASGARFLDVYHRSGEPGGGSYVVDTAAGPTMLEISSSSLRLFLLDAGVVPELRGVRFDRQVENLSETAVIPIRDPQQPDRFALLRQTPDGSVQIDTPVSSSAATESNRQLSIAEGLATLETVYTASDRDRLYGALKSGELWVLDLINGHTQRLPPPEPQAQDRLAAAPVALAPNGIGAVALDQQLYIGDLSADAPSWRAGPQMSSVVCALALSSSAKWLATSECSTGLARVQVYEIEGDTIALVRTLDSSIDTVASLSISDDGGTVAAGSASSQIAVWRDGVPMQLGIYESPAPSHPNYVSGWVSVSPGGDWVVTRTDLSDLELWYSEHDSMKLVGSLAVESEETVPTYVSFTTNALTIAWGHAADPRISSWPLTADGAGRITCRDLLNGLKPIDGFKCRPILKSGLARTPPPEIDASSLGGPPAVPLVGIGEVKRFALPPAQYLGMDSDPEGGVWLGAIGSVVHVSPSGDLMSSNNGTDNVSLAALPNGELWTSGGIVLNRLLGTEWKQLNFSDLGTSNLVDREGEAILLVRESQASDYSISICQLSIDGICRQLAELGGQPYQGDAQVKDLAILPAGGLVASYTRRYKDSIGFLYWIDGDTWTKISLDDDRSPGDLAIDATGALWMTIADRREVGVIGPDDSEVAFLAMPNDLEAVDITADPRGKVWIATGKGLATVLPDGSIGAFDLDEVQPKALIASSDGHYLWLLDDEHDQIIEVAID